MNKNKFSFVIIIFSVLVLLIGVMHNFLSDFLIKPIFSDFKERFREIFVSVLK